MPTPPEFEADTVTPVQDPTDTSFLRHFLRNIDDDHARMVLEMEIFLREVWTASLGSVGERRRAARYEREKRWLERELGRRARESPEAPF